MAAADYRLCDVCGCKAFYDANLNYDDPNELSAVGLDYVGAWAVICNNCAETHEVKIVDRRAPEPAGREVEWAAQNFGDYWLIEVSCDKPRYYSIRKSDGQMLELPHRDSPFVPYPAPDSTVAFQKSSGCVFCDLECCNGEHTCTVDLEQVIADLERIGKEDGWICASVGANLLRRLSRREGDVVDFKRDEPERYVVLKASGSRYAYVNDTHEGRTVKRYDVLKGSGRANGWEMAKEHARQLNAPFAPVAGSGE